MDRSFVARLGSIVFAVALVSLWVAPSSQARSVVGVSAAFGSDVGAVLDPGTTTPSLPAPTTVAFEMPEIQMPVSRSLARASSVEEAVAVLGVIAAPAVPPVPAPEPLVTDGVVLASWYGPGFFGNKTACGQTYTPEIMGVAHRTLRCGTLLRITSPAGQTVTVAVIDRGPFIAGRSLDLSNATRQALQCSDLCHVHVTVLD
ncbi:MAG: hypothetical protein HYX56_02800 [Chloroflexi bacterium]|nr:hypothetical protein [Chloroflexota bacterium]